MDELVEEAHVGPKSMSTAGHVAEATSQSRLILDGERRGRAYSDLRAFVHAAKDSMYTSVSQPCVARRSAICSRTTVLVLHKHARVRTHATA